MTLMFGMLGNDEKMLYFSIHSIIIFFFLLSAFHLVPVTLSIIVKFFFKKTEV